MSKYRCSIATNRVDQELQKLSSESLGCIARESVGMPVKDSFGGEIVGKVVSSNITPDGSCVDAYIELDVDVTDSMIGRLYVVPGYEFETRSVDQRFGYIEYHRVKLTELSLTLDPADGYIKPISRVDGNDISE